MRLRRLDVRHFKAFEKFTLHLGPDAFLVGPNNAGKSTLISAVRAGAEMLRYAGRRRAAAFPLHNGRRVRGHLLQPVVKALVTENLRHEFRSAEASLTLKTDTDLVLRAVWPAEDVGYESVPFFNLESHDGRLVSEPSMVRKGSGEMGIVSSLYPVNHRERVLTRDYLNEHFESRRASQHTRNHLLRIRDDGEWDEFNQYLLGWLPEISEIEVSVSPSADPGEQDIDVFVTEDGSRTPKELFWIGDGVQVFIQLLTHCWRLRAVDVIVLDEPDLYLHADLQRRLVRLLESINAQTITATHSPEMLAEAAADSVIWVDKSRRQGVRRPAAATLEDLSAQIGSRFNLRLAAALRARTVLFVEGQDMSLLRKVALTVGATSLAAERQCAVIGMEGFSKWVHVEPFSWLLDKFLDNAVEVFVLLDRDYRTDGQVALVESSLKQVGVRGHVWHRKELESYLIEPATIHRLTKLAVDEVTDRLALITERMTAEVMGEFLAAHQTESVGSGKAPSTVLKGALNTMNALTSDPEWRLWRYPAKRIISSLNSELQAEARKTVSPSSLARAMKTSEVPHEMVEWINEVEASLNRH